MEIQKAWLVLIHTKAGMLGNRIRSELFKGIGLEDIQGYTLTSECLGQSQHNENIKSDTLLLAGLGLPPAKLGPSQTDLDAICKNAKNPQFWSYAHPQFLG